MNCYFKRENNKFILGNSYIERVWNYEEGKFYTSSVRDKVSGHEWVSCNHETTDFFYEGLSGKVVNHEPVCLELELAGAESGEVKDPVSSGSHLEAIFHFVNSIVGLEIKYHAVIYDKAAAIRTFLEVKSFNFPTGDFFNGFRLNIADTYPLLRQEGKLESYEFFTRSDHTNEFVLKKDESQGFDRGNLLVFNQSCGKGFFILKESPCYTDMRPETEGCFHISEDRIWTLGWGIRPEEIRDSEFLKTYGSVIGTFEGNEEQGILALKKYQRERFPILPEKDYMVMANPWGDRHCMEHMGEAFVIAELEACRRIGATHYQLDDGWEKGNGLIHLVNNERLGKDFWEIDPERFPNGFDKLAEKAKELGIELGLWFAPDRNRLFRNYEEQGDLLFDFYKKYDIKKFKIDIVYLKNKECEDNLEKLFLHLWRKTNGDIRFNLDTTADARAGYFMFLEYGNIFLENRYTVPGFENTYYPWRTLKNVWDLSRFVPLQKLQIEFLNIVRSIEEYDKNDILAPGNYTYEYVFSIAMFANPLCWLEPSALDNDAATRFRAMIELHKKYRNEIFEGFIFPIGSRPSGYSWAGFQSYNPDTQTGFVIVYREYHPRDSFSYSLLFMEGRHVTLECLSHNDEVIEIENYDGKGITFRLESFNSFKLYKYRIA